MAPDYQQKLAQFKEFKQKQSKQNNSVKESQGDTQKSKKAPGAQGQGEQQSPYKQF